MARRRTAVPLRPGVRRWCEVVRGRAAVTAVRVLSGGGAAVRGWSWASRAPHGGPGRL